MSKTSRGVAGRVALSMAVAYWLIAGLDRSVLGQKPRPAFRAGVDLVSLSVTVTDSSQRHVAGLNRDDFVVFENDVPQDLAFFGRANVPLALALLIDTSASMEQALPTAQEAAIGFVRRLGPSDVATVIDFDSRVRTAQAFTGDFGALETAIRGTTAGGSTTLYHAVYIALKELNKLIPSGDIENPRRRAIVVLSDGDDTSSLIGFDDVLELASRSDTIIYAIGLGARIHPRARQPQDGQFVLRQLAQQTGGRAFFPREAEDLAGVYGDIRNELASQYLLAYESSSGPADGQWRRIAVRVSRPGVAVRARQGYYAAGTR